jgi:hypothetical protein
MSKHESSFINERIILSGAKTYNSQLTPGIVPDLVIKGLPWPLRGYGSFYGSVAQRDLVIANEASKRRMQAHQCHAIGFSLAYIYFIISAYLLEL